MRIRALLAVAALALLFPATRSADALKTETTVTPANLKEVEGLSLESERRGDGRIRFTVRRDPVKANWQLRTGDLHVAVAAGDVLDCAVHARTTAAGLLEYQFTLSRDAVAHSEFVLREVRGADTGVGGVEIVGGGGEFYVIRLGDFAPKARGLGHPTPVAHHAPRPRHASGGRQSARP